MPVKSTRIRVSAVILGDPDGRTQRKLEIRAYKIHVLCGFPGLYAHRHLDELNPVKLSHTRWVITEGESGFSVLKGMENETLHQLVIRTRTYLEKIGWFKFCLERDKHVNEYEDF